MSGLCTVMPNRTLILEAAVAAALAAAAVLLLCAWPWRTTHGVRRSVGAVLGVGVGFFVGCWLLGTSVKWPPAEDQHRLLLILFPSVFIAELVAVLAGQWRWLAWALRILIA